LETAHEKQLAWQVQTFKLLHGFHMLALMIFLQASVSTDSDGSREKLHHTIKDRITNNKGS